jgi:hypothetical protein
MFCGATAASFNDSDLPYRQAFFYLAVLLGALALESRKREVLSATLVSAAFVSLALGVLEHVISRGSVRREYSEPFNFSHKSLGYGPFIDGDRLALARTIHASAYFGTDVVYEVSYSFGSSGWRIVPDSTPTASECVAFLGDSFTFGEGVEDHETLPSAVARIASPGVQVYNFAFPGWGPHQILAGLIDGRFEVDDACENTSVVYLMLNDHIRRAAGRAPWDQDGPLFEMSGDTPGRVDRAGTARDAQASPFQRIVLQQLRKSQVYGLLATFIWGWPDFVPADEDFERLGAIVVEIGRQINERFGARELNVLVYDLPINSLEANNEYRKQVLSRIDSPDIRVYSASSAVADYEKGPERFWIHQADRHPSPLVYDLIGRFVVEEILKEGRPPSRSGLAVEESKE